MGIPSGTFKMPQGTIIILHMTTPGSFTTNFRCLFAFADHRFPFRFLLYSAAPSDTADRRDRDASPGNGKEENARNTGTNLFVTGIHPKLTEDDVSKIFSKYGEVVKCNIMLDPHTRESRGFGFVNFAASDQADAAKDGLQNETFEGRTLSIEKARRNRPRTPTPGKYFGPPKR